MRRSLSFQGTNELGVGPDGVGLEPLDFGCSASMVDFLHDAVLVGTEITGAPHHIVPAKELLIVKMMDGEEFL